MLIDVRAHWDRTRARDRWDHGAESRSQHCARTAQAQSEPGVLETRAARISGECALEGAAGDLQRCGGRGGRTVSASLVPLGQKLGARVRHHGAKLLAFLGEEEAPGPTIGQIANARREDGRVIPRSLNLPQCW